jgi:TPR repeat protein
MSAADAAKLAQIQARAAEDRLANRVQTAEGATDGARAAGERRGCWVPWALTLLVTVVGVGVFAALSPFASSTAADDAVEIERLAQAGEPGAQLALALILDHGFRGVAGDSAQAREWYQRAAESGSVSAQYYLGNWYLTARSQEPDVDTALHWLGRAAGREHVEAQLLLADLYRAGNRVTKDLAAAAIWYGRAADAGNADAMCAMARLYAGIEPGYHLDPPRAAMHDHMAQALGKDCGLKDLGYGASAALASWATQEGVRLGEERLAKGFTRRPAP